MTPDETVVLARYVRALCPQQKFDEYTPDAWHDVLGDWPLAAARAAAAAVAKQQPFVSPAEIIGEIRRQRDAKADSFQGPGLPAEIPDADPDDVPAYLAALRAQRTRAADGMELKRRPVAELISGVVDSFGDIPNSDVTEKVAEVRRPGPLGVECPTCRAAIGRPCRVEATSGNRGPRELRNPHAARGRVARGEPASLESPAEIDRRRAVSLAHLERLAANDAETRGESA
ncbi:zinc finger domain-containing protein [Streptomyces scopuliridis]|uniref:zinc finger domain-containing protein n=1 Tax=Streptomyces scopuliridis TaxID=452529 RepID=UPI0035E3B0D1